MHRERVGKGSERERGRGREGGREAGEGIRERRERSMPPFSSLLLSYFSIFA